VCENCESGTPLLVPVLIIVIYAKILTPGPQSGRLATDAKAQIKSMADGNDAVMDMRVQELRDELERESEIRLTTEQAMRLLVKPYTQNY
jgi:hypothetical protein